MKLRTRKGMWLAFQWESDPTGTWSQVSWPADWCALVGVGTWTLSGHSPRSLALHPTDGQQKSGRCETLASAHGEDLGREGILLSGPARLSFPPPGLQSLYPHLLWVLGQSGPNVNSIPWAQGPGFILSEELLVITQDTDRTVPGR